jgi:hypothetical protein
MASKKPDLTLKDLDGATSVDDLPTMQPLIAEVERLANDLGSLDKETQAVVANKASYSPYKLGKLEERRAPIEASLVEARLRVDEERSRLQREIETLFRPVLYEAVIRLIKALEKVIMPLDDELRDLEIRCARYVPFYGRIRLRHSADDLRLLTSYLQQQKPH